MDRGDIIYALLGAIIGLAISGFFLAYLPMKANYDECGRVTLCQTKEEGDDLS